MALRSILHLRLIGPGSEDAQAKSGALAELCRRTTPAWVMKPHGAYLDLTGTERLYGRGLDGLEHVSRLARDVGGIRAAGAGPSRLAARLASLTAARAGGGLFSVAPGMAAVFLQAFPVDFLAAPASVSGRLQKLGVRTLGDLQVVPPALLKTVFGAGGPRLTREAWGWSPGLVEREAGARREGSLPLELVVGVGLSRPVSSAAVGSALRRGLAVRALTRCPRGPASRGNWRLTGFWPEGRRASVTVRGAAHPGWKSWLGLLDLLWRRLPHRRKGLVGLELRAQSSVAVQPAQGNLFPEDEADCRLAEAMRRVRLASGAPLGTACEDLLSAWGAVWYGPGGDRPKSGQGFG
ncbi:MAG: hypothetical protein ABFS42_10240 [Candidatus Krumholzibacteriota bacterium]